MSKKKSSIIHASGARKSAVARATLRPGTGKIMINKIGVDQYGNELNKARIMEPMILAGDIGAKYDVTVRVEGGGGTGQADAARLAIGRALAQVSEKLRQVFLDYDRMLIVADVRRKEPRKPNTRGNARAKRQKSYR